MLTEPSYVWQGRAFNRGEILSKRVGYRKRSHKAESQVDLMATDAAVIEGDELKK